MHSANRPTSSLVFLVVCIVVLIAPDVVCTFARMAVLALFVIYCRSYAASSLFSTTHFIPNQIASQHSTHHSTLFLLQRTTAVIMWYIAYADGRSDSAFPKTFFPLDSRPNCIAPLDLLGLEGIALLVLFLFLFFSVVNPACSRVPCDGEGVPSWSIRCSIGVCSFMPWAAELRRCA